MQVYGVLDILTARPSAADMAVAPHHLYGHVPPDRAHSTGAWLREAAMLAARAGREGGPLIFTGGTGLYFEALTGGLSDMPDVPAPIREAWRARLAGEGPEALHAVLREKDAESAARIGPSDGQRLVRALEVIEYGGRPLGYWRRKPGRPLIDAARARLILIEPDRALLRNRIDARFEAMVSAGALEEVRALLSLGLDPALPAMKAIGVRELAAVLEGRIGIAAALDRAKAATRQYAKRQMTWFRNRFGPEWRKLGIGASLEKIDSPLPN